MSKIEETEKLLDLAGVTVVNAAVPLEVISKMAETRPDFLSESLATEVAKSVAGVRDFVEKYNTHKSVSETVGNVDSSDMSIDLNVKLKNFMVTDFISKAFSRVTVGKFNADFALFKENNTGCSEEEIESFLEVELLELVVNEKVNDILAEEVKRRESEIKTP